MNHSISNIIWKKNEDNLEDFLKLLYENNISYVELALNCFWEEPVEVDNLKINYLKGLLEKYNLRISALHSLTYTREDLELFGSKSKKFELLDYLKRYIDLAYRLNARNIVYGSPKSRKVHSRSRVDCDLIFLEFLSEIDRNANNLIFNIEPLPVSYCEYLNSFMDGYNILQMHNFKNIYIQLDVRSIIESQEDIDIIFNHPNFIKHVHVGDPGLKTPEIQFKEIHLKIREKLREIKYDGCITAEVIYQNTNSYENEVINCINVMQDYYKVQ